MIDTPASTLLWEVGESVSFTGHASDPEQGTLPASSLSWTLLMQHCPSNCHSHTIQSWPGVASGSFSAPDHEYPSYLELKLTATDAGSLSATATLRLDPQTVVAHLRDEPCGSAALRQRDVVGDTLHPHGDRGLEQLVERHLTPVAEWDELRVHVLVGRRGAVAQHRRLDRRDTYTASYASQPSGNSAVADFDGDGDTDISVFRPSQGGWYMQGQPPFPQLWGSRRTISRSR